MSIIDWFTKNKKNTDISIKSTIHPIEKEEWIDVSYNYTYGFKPKDGKNYLPETEKSIKKVLAEESINLMEVCNNQEKYISPDKKYLTSFNPIIDGETFVYRDTAYIGKGIGHFEHLKKIFISEFSKLNKHEWTIKIFAKYSPIDLLSDMTALIDLQNKLTAYLEIDNSYKGMVEPYFDFDSKGDSIYKEVRGLFRVSCKVEDRISLSKIDKDLDINLFNGLGIYEFIEKIRDNSKDRFSKKWLLAVNKLKS